MKDNVKSPDHYNFPTCGIAYSTERGLSPALFSVIKYVGRSKFKNGREDLCKALWFLLYELGLSKKEIGEMIDRVDAIKELANDNLQRPQ